MKSLLLSSLLLAASTPAALIANDCYDEINFDCLLQIGALTYCSANWSSVPGNTPLIGNMIKKWSGVTMGPHCGIAAINASIQIALAAAGRPIPKQGDPCGPFIPGDACLER